MKITFILLTTAISLIASSVSFNSISKPEYQGNKETLKYDESLGIFKDQTSEEIQTYYGALSTKTGIKGEELQTSLESIIKQNQIYQSYSQRKYYYLLDRNWDSTPLTDTEISTQKRNQTGIKLHALYDSEDLEVTSTNTTPQGAIGQIINREHVWVKSRGLMRDSEGNPSYMSSCDLQNLHAGEAKNNQTGHNNYPYGDVLDKSASSTVKSTSKISGTVTGWRGLNKDGIEVYEPLPSDKGNIARTLFYMETRYHTYDEVNKTPALKLDDAYEKDVTTSVESTQTTAANYGLLSTLLEWNESDPVDDEERHRNNLCYNVVTKNRNPFIDFPKWVDCIYNSDKSGGIDIKDDEGLKGDLTIEEIDNPLFVHPNDPVNLDSIVVKYNDQIIRPTDYTFQLVTSSGNIDFVSGQTLSEVGDYTIVVNYKLESYVFKNYIYVKVRDKVNDNFGTDNVSVDFKDVSIEKGNTTDLSSIDLKLTDEYGETHIITKDDYTIELTTPSGKKEIYTSDYAFNEEGTYIATYTYVFNDKTYTIDKKIIVTLSFFEANKIWIIIACIGVGAIIVTLSIYRVSHPKKRRKKSKHK